MRALAAVVTVLALAGCSNQPEQACTMIGAPSGIAVTVERDVAADLRGLVLTVCWDDSCDDREVVLAPGSDTVDQGCDGTGPDAACSATAVPNGTKIGFVDLPDLPADLIMVGARLSTASGTSSYDPVQVQAAQVYPNGPNCPAGGNQAEVTVSRSGVA